MDRPHPLPIHHNDHRHISHFGLLMADTEFQTQYLYNSQAPALNGNQLNKGSPMLPDIVLPPRIFSRTHHKDNLLFSVHQQRHVGSYLLCNPRCGVDFYEDEPGSHHKADLPFLQKTLLISVYIWACIYSLQ